jgi:hypothetical protein
VSTNNLLNLVSTNNLIDLISTANILGLISTQNLSLFVSTPSLVSTTSQLQSNIENWAFYAAQSSIVFANQSPAIPNAIIANGGTYIKLQTDTAVYALTAQNVLKPMVASEMAIVNAIPANYSYSLTAGQTYTGYVSALTVLKTSIGSSNVGSLYVSSLYMGNTGGTSFGEITANAANNTIFYNNRELAYMSTVFSTNFATQSNIFSTSSGLQSNIREWSKYTTVTDVTFSNGTGVIMANPSQTFQIKSGTVSIVDVNGGYGTLTMGNALDLRTSSSQEYYSLGFGQTATGTISSFAVIRGVGLAYNTGSLYLSSLYLGDVGGTTAGQLTTDVTATDLYWKGSKLNNQGGGVQTSNLVSTTAQLQSNIENWAIYPAQSSIVFANQTPGTYNSIIANGGTILKLQTDPLVAGVGSLTSNDVANTFFGSGYVIGDAIPTSFSYTLTGGSSYTGEVSTATFINDTAEVTSLYLSTLFLGNTGGTEYGQLTVNPKSKILFNGSELAYMSTVFSTVAGLQTSQVTIPLNLISTVNTVGGIAFNNLSTTAISAATATVSTFSFINVAPASSNLWVAVGTDSTANNTIKYSYDGITWSNSSGIGFSSDGYNVAYNGTMWVAVGVDSTANNTIKYSYNGINWSNSSGTGFTGTSQRGVGIAWNGRIWVAVGRDDTQNNTIKYSLDGITWSNSSGTGFNVQGWAVAWNGTLWVAVGDNTAGNTIRYSFDGISWTIVNAFTSLGRDVAWNGRLWVSVGNDTTANNKIKYSIDGITWSNSIGASYSGVACGIAWNGYMWVAVGFDTNTMKYSFDGISWSNGSGGFTSGGEGIAWNGRMWIAVGSDSAANNRIKYSFDGINWSNSSGTGFSGSAFGVAYSSNLTPAYQQQNLSILPQNIPIFITSTNRILAQPSSLVINETLSIDGRWERVGINCNVPRFPLDVDGLVNASTLMTRTQRFIDLGTTTIGDTLFQSTMYLYFGANVVAPARVAPIQTITF